MKIKKGFQLRNICDTNVVVAQGIENINFSKIINLNDSAAWLWEEIKGKEFDAVILAGLLMERYEVGIDTAQQDAEDLIAAWLDAGIIEN